MKPGKGRPLTRSSVPTCALAAWVGAAVILTVPSIPRAQGGPDPNSLRLRLEGEAGPCIREGDLVICWESGFTALENDVERLEAQIGILRLRNSDASDDLLALQQTSRLALESVENDLRNCRQASQGWWTRHKPRLAFALATLGTGAIAGGLALGGEAGVTTSTFLILGGTVSELIGLAIAW